MAANISRRLRVFANTNNNLRIARIDRQCDRQICTDEDLFQCSLFRSWLGERIAELRQLNVWLDRQTNGEYILNFRSGLC